MPTPQNQAAAPSILGGGETSIQQLYQMGLNFIQGVCTILVLPVEYVLRPGFGSRYFNPVATFFACIMMFIFAGLGAFGPHVPSVFGHVSNAPFTTRLSAFPPCPGFSFLATSSTAYVFTGG
jgi:hypothetical protein